MSESVVSNEPDSPPLSYVDPFLMIQNIKNLSINLITLVGDAEIKQFAEVIRRFKFISLKELTSQPIENDFSLKNTLGRRDSQIFLNHATKIYLDFEQYFEFCPHLRPLIVMFKYLTS